MDKGQFRYCRKALQDDTGVAGQQGLILFDILQESTLYNNATLAKKTVGTPLSKHLAVNKTRLFNLLLKHLGILEESRQSVNAPRKKLKEGRLLLHMLMLEEAEEVVLKGLRTIQETQDLFVEVELRELLREIYKNKNDQKEEQKQTENDYLLETASSKLATLIRFTHINDRAFDYLRRYRVSDSEGVKRGMDELINRPEMSDSKKANSLPSQLRYYSIWSFYLSSLGKLDQAIESLEQALVLYEQNPARSAFEPMSHISIITNIIGKLNIIGKSEQVPMYLKKLEQITTRGRRAEVFKFAVVELQYQLYYMNAGKLEDALLREPVIMAGLKNYGRQVLDGHRLTFLYNLGVTHLVTNNHKMAYKHFNRIMNLGRLAMRTDLQGVARLLRLLLLSQNKDNVEINHFLRNSKRFFGSKDRNYMIEVIVHRWLKKHNGIVGTTERKESLKSFSNFLEPLILQGRLGAEEMFIWASAKQRGIKPIMVFQERLESQ